MVTISNYILNIKPLLYSIAILYYTQYQTFIILNIKPLSYFFPKEISDYFPKLKKINDEVTDA